MFGAIGVFTEIAGPANLVKLLKLLKIPMSYDQCLIAAYVCLAIVILTTIVIKKNREAKKYKY